MTRHPRGDVPADATASLIGRNTLTPRFTAELGSYVVTLRNMAVANFEQRTAQVRIDVVPSESWVPLGPDGANTRRADGVWSPFTGRVNAVAIHPTSPATMYAAAARGGVWRSDDSGGSWWPMTDGKGLPRTQSVGRLAVLSSGRVLAGTGDPENGGYFTADSGALYQSDDGGITWQQVVLDPACPPGSVAPQGTPTRIAIDPSLTNGVVVAGTGLYRSVDGGRCWQDLLPGQVVQDVVFTRQSSGSTFLWAAGSGTTIGVAVQRSSDLTSATTPITWSSSTSAVNTPALASPLTRISLASSGDVAYAVVAQGPVGAVTGQVRVFRSAANAAWVERTEPRDATGNSRCDGQCNYNLSAAARPGSPNDIVVGTVTVFRSTDGGASWSELNPGGSVYSDQHTLVFHPTNSDLLFTGNDGGLQRLQLSALGVTLAGWVPINHGMFTGLFEGLALPRTAASESYALGGLQDAGTRWRTDGRRWVIVGGGDGKRAAIDASDPSVLYFTDNWGTSGGAFSRYTGPGSSQSIGNANAIWSDPFRPGVLLGLAPAGTDGLKLYYAGSATTATAAAWTCIDPTPGNPNDFSQAVAFFPQSGRYLVGTASGGIYDVSVPATPSVVTPCQAGMTASNSTLMWQAPNDAAGNPTAIASLAVDPRGNGTVVYATVRRYDAFRVVMLQRSVVPDGAGNLRISWTPTAIAGAPGAPDAFPSNNDSCVQCFSPLGTFMNPVVVDPRRSDRLFVGTDNGIIEGVRQPGGQWRWRRDPESPEVWVTDLRTTNEAGTQGPVSLRASTFGRGVLEHVVFASPSLIGRFIADVRALRHIGDWRRASEQILAVDYRLPRAAASSAVVRARVEGSGGVVDAHFKIEQATIQPGEGVVLLSVLYLDGRAPIAFDTSAIVVELVTTAGAVLESQRIPMSLAWQAPGARTLTLGAELSSGEGPPALINVTFEASSETPLVAVSPSAKVLLAGNTVVLTAPQTISIGSGEAQFVGWRGVGDREASSPEVRLRIDDNMEVVARYRLLNPR